MPFQNYESRHFTAREEKEIQTAIKVLRDLLRPKYANLTKEERQKLGSINEQNKLFAGKVRDYHQRDPDLSSPDVDWAEFTSDFKSRDFIEGVLDSLAGITEAISNAKILHDYDVYQAALTDYNYTKYKSGTSVPGFNKKLDEMKQFFAKSPRDSGGEETSEEE